MMPFGKECLPYKINKWTRIRLHFFKMILLFCLIPTISEMLYFTKSPLDFFYNCTKLNNIKEQNCQGTLKLQKIKRQSKNLARYVCLFHQNFYMALKILSELYIVFFLSTRYCKSCLRCLKKQSKTPVSSSIQSCYIFSSKWIYLWSK